MTEKPPRLTGEALWLKSSRTPTADRDLDTVLGSVTSLPLKYWRPHFYFTGARDRLLYGLTRRMFPVKPVRKKTHPIFTRRLLAHQAGMEVCPCSTKRPYNQSICHFIQKGCTLRHTGHVMNRNSYLVETVTFNMPASVAAGLLFRGEVPVQCIIPVKP